jgi:hypothetical protein
LGVDELIIAGDAFDFKAVSAWFNRELIDIPLEVELANGKAKLKRIADAFKDKVKIFIKGNHEQRIIDYICKNASKVKNLSIGGKSITSIPDVLDLELMGFGYVDNKELIQLGLPAFSIGKLFVLHGHEPQKVGYQTINPAKLYYERIRTNAVVFHLHRTSEWLITKPLEHSIEGCWTGGCLCSLHPDYATINNWMPGFVIVERDSNGYFELKNHKIVNGRVV